MLATTTIPELSTENNICEDSIPKSDNNSKDYFFVYYSNDEGDFHKTLDQVFHQRRKETAIDFMPETETTTNRSFYSLLAWRSDIHFHLNEPHYLDNLLQSDRYDYELDRLSFHAFILAYLLYLSQNKLLMITQYDLLRMKTIFVDGEQKWLERKMVVDMDKIRKVPYLQERRRRAQQMNDDQYRLSIWDRVPLGLFNSSSSDQLWNIQESSVCSWLKHELDILFTRLTCSGYETDVITTTERNTIKDILIYHADGKPVDPETGLTPRIITALPNKTDVFSRSRGVNQTRKIPSTRTTGSSSSSSLSLNKSYRILSSDCQSPPQQPGMAFDQFEIPDIEDLYQCGLPPCIQRMGIQFGTVTGNKRHPHGMEGYFNNRRNLNLQKITHDECLVWTGYMFEWLLLYYDLSNRTQEGRFDLNDPVHKEVYNMRMRKIAKEYAFMTLERDSSIVSYPTTDLDEDLDKFFEGYIPESDEEFEYFFEHDPKGKKFYGSFHKNFYAKAYREQEQWSPFGCKRINELGFCPFNTGGDGDDNETIHLQRKCLHSKSPGTAYPALERVRNPADWRNK